MIKGAEEEIVEKIKKSEARDDKVIKTVEEMKKAEVKLLVARGYKESKAICRRM